jgi:hypothetical protein
MRPLIFTAGSLISAMGFVADAMIGDPALFQGALTLGGGFLICGLFSFSAKWHGIIGAAVLALLGAARCAPALLDLPNKTQAAPFQAIAFLICTVVLVTIVRALRTERAQRQMEELAKLE